MIAQRPERHTPHCLRRLETLDDSGGGLAHTQAAMLPWAPCGLALDFEVALVVKSRRAPAFMASALLGVAGAWAGACAREVLSAGRLAAMGMPVLATGASKVYGMRGKMQGGAVGNVQQHYDS